MGKFSRLFGQKSCEARSFWSVLILENLEGQHLHHF